MDGIELTARKSMQNANTGGFEGMSKRPMELRFLRFARFKLPLSGRADMEKHGSNCRWDYVFEDQDLVCLLLLTLGNYRGGPSGPSGRI